jgi:signal transduction histidine kinase
MISPLEEMLVRNAISNHIVAARHEVELIYRNGLRLLKLVNTLLDFSRIEAGRTQAVYELIDLSVYTAEIASSFRSAMEKAELDFIVHCPPLHVPAYVDRDMWEKIVLNLLSRE